MYRGEDACFAILGPQAVCNCKIETCEEEGMVGVHALGLFFVI